MFKRTVWFTVGAVGGAVTGAGATVYGFVRLRESRGALSPDRMAVVLVGTARAVGRSTRAVGESARSSLRDAVTEGRLAMAEAELRIIEELEGGDRSAGRRIRRPNPERIRERVPERIPDRAATASQ
jgi:hypothetical protein